MSGEALLAASKSLVSAKAAIHARNFGAARALCRHSVEAIAELQAKHPEWWEDIVTDRRPVEQARKFLGDAADAAQTAERRSVEDGEYKHWLYEIEGVHSTWAITAAVEALTEHAFAKALGETDAKR